MRLALLALLTLAPPLHAQSPVLRPGDYALEGGGGTLSLKAAGPGRFGFTFETVGANAHTCALDGLVADGVARLEPDDAVCVVRFKFATCRQVLEPLAKDAAMTDTQVRDEFPPTDAGSYLPVVRATRTNLELCAPR